MCTIQVNVLQDVHELALVLVNTFDLDIKEGIGADCDIAASLDQLCQANFVGALDRDPLLPELGIIHLVVETLQKSEILEPLVVSKCFCDKGAQLRVGLVQPASGRDTISLVHKLFLAIVGDKVTEDLRCVVQRICQTMCVVYEFRDC